MPTNVAALRATLSRQSGILTRQINRYEKAKDLPPTPVSLAQVESYLEKATDAFEKVTNLVEELSEADNARAAEYAGRLDNDTARFDELAHAIGGMLASAAPAPAVPVAAPPVPPAPQQHFKVVDALRPDTLTLEFTPSEFHLWTTSFKSYHSASHLERLAHVDQHAFAYACMDANLQKRILPLVTVDTPVFADEGEDSLISFINDLFLQRYPLMQRRLDFFQYQHSPGQLVSTWIAELRMKSDIADLEDLTVDQLLAFRVITGVQDGILQDELLKLKNPSLKDVETEVLLFEAKQATKAKATVHRVQARPLQPPGQQPHTCFRCGKSGHLKRNCHYPASVVCRKCQQPGHIAPACKERTQARVVEDPPPVDEFSVTNAVFVRSLAGANLPTPKLEVHYSQGQKSFTFLSLPDTGATRTIIAQDVADRFGLVLSPASDVILAANKMPMECAGSVRLSAFLGAKEAKIDALVSSELSQQILLSWHDLKSLDVLMPDFPAQINVNYANANAILPSFVNKLFQDYSDVISDNLGTRCLEGPPMSIYLRTDEQIKPFKIFTTRQIPLHLQDEADRVVNKALEEGIIAREDGPTDWCCRGGFVPKPNGKLRLITDFIPLNKYVDRPVHPFPSSLDIIQAIKPDSKVFVVLDCTMGYYQVPLDERSSKLTTFLLPQGCFRYCRAPMGLSASSDEFCRRSDDALRGLAGIHKLVDDILVQAPDRDILFLRLEALLSRCRSHGLTLSRRKAQFCIYEGDKPVKFAGYLVSGAGVQPDPDKILALRQFKPPASVSELRSFLGLANQLGFFIPDLAHLSGRMRLLLKKGVAFVWTDDIQEDFEKIKSLLASSLVVHPFDPALKTSLLTDASRIGLGFILMQYGPAGQPRLVHCGSRSLISAESRYAIIELECLAVTYAMLKCQFYLRGLSRFTLVTDHRPLVGLFNKSLQDVTNPRIQRFREKIAPFTFDVRWIAGKENLMADALSRAPCFGPEQEEGIDVPVVASMIAVEDPRLGKILAAVDLSYRNIMEALMSERILSSFSQDHPARPFANVWDRLSIVDGLLILDGHRIVPPVGVRPELLESLHLSHAGVLRCRKLAQQLYYWPGINNDIKNMIDRCAGCQMMRPSQQAEPQIHTVAHYPMQETSVDPFEYRGKHYLMMADRFSGYIWVQQFHNQATSSIISILMSWFLDFGFPGTVRTDGGPQFRSEFDQFCVKYGIRHDVSSPLYPNANGHAEANVKSAKYLLAKCCEARQDFRVGLMELRNTPRSDGYSPAQLFYGRRQRTLLPCLDSHLKPVDVLLGHDIRERIAAKHRAEVDSRAKLLPRLLVGQKVIMQDAKTKRWLDQGVITDCLGTGRSYYIRLNNGKTLWRNRRYLRPVGADLDEKAGMEEKDSADFQRVLRPRVKRSYTEKRIYRKKTA